VKTITIHLDTETDDPRRSVQVIPSDGIDPQTAINACWRAMALFQSQLIQAEIKRGVAERMDEAAAEEE